MRERSVWALAWRRFRRDRLGSASMVVVLIYIAIMVAVAAGVLVRDWSEEAGFRARRRTRRARRRSRWAATNGDAMSSRRW